MEIAKSCSDLEVGNEMVGNENAKDSDSNENSHNSIPPSSVREKMLGFKPQREIIYNHLLPYNQLLDAESEQQWREIKVNMSLSVVLRDPRIAGLHWLSQLSKYIRMYSFKFSLDDHLEMVRLIYEVIQTPGMEYSLIQKYASSLNQLLRKRELIERKDLKLEWRPLYRLLLGIVDSNHESYGLVSNPENIESVLKNLVRVCRIYFPVESTQEMLDEWRPMFCPFDTKMTEALGFCEIFLPTLVYPEEHGLTFKLWFDEFMVIYGNSCSTPVFESSLVSLFSRLARDNIGYIDWEQHLDVIFTRILSSLNLPVGSDKVKVGRGMDNYSVNNSAKWIVAMLSPTNTTLDHTTSLFKALNSYYHPSNHGSWTSKLLKLPKRLALEFVLRTERENYRPTVFSHLTKDCKGSWEPMIPLECRSNDDLIDQFVRLLVTPLLSSMFSKAGSSEAMLTFKYLSSVRPEIVVPPLLESTYSSLETLTEPHRLISCLQCTTAVMSNMVLYSDRYPEGRSHVIPLLSLCLPGIDPNDLNKSMMTFRLISILTLLVPLVDCSQAYNYYQDLTPLEEELCSATAQFEDIVLQFFDRVIALIDTSSHQHTRTDSNDASKMSHEESIYEISLFYTSKAVLKQCSKPIFMEALKKIQSLAIGSVFEHKVSGRFVTKILKAAVKVRPEIVLEKFVPHCCDLILSRLNSEDLSKEEHLDSEILWNLQILSEVFCCDGKAFLPYIDQITQVLDLTLALKCKDSLHFANITLKNILKSTTSIYVLNSYSFDVSVDTPLKDFLPVRSWGKPGNLYTLRPVWHHPNPQQIDFSTQLLQRYLSPRLTAIDDFCDGEGVPIERDDLLNILNVVSTCMSGMSSIAPDWGEDGGDDVKLDESPVSLQKFGLISNLDQEGLQINGKNMRLLISEHMQRLLKYLLAHGEDDTKSLLVIIKVIVEAIHSYSHMREDFKRTWSDGKSYLENRLIGKKRHIRQVLVKRLQLQHELRATSQSARRFTQSHLDLYKHLFLLATSRYMQVRKTAQAALNKSFRHFTFSYRTVIGHIVRNLEGVRADGGTVEIHEFKGTLYLILGESRSCLMAKRHWSIANQLWPAMIKSPLYTKPSLVTLHNKIVEKLMNEFETNEIHVKVTDEAIRNAQGILKVYGLDLGEEELKGARERELGVNEARERDYLKLVDTLVDIVNNGEVSWKFALSCHDLISLMTRNDLDLPYKAIKLFVGCLISEQLMLRRMGIASICGVLQQLKRSRTKEVVNLKSVMLPYRRSAQNTNNNNNNNDNNNNNNDDDNNNNNNDDNNNNNNNNNNDNNNDSNKHNSWLIYDESKVPKTAEEYGRYTFVDQTYNGYYAWPKYLTCHRSAIHQPKLGRSRSELAQAETAFHDFFSDRKLVEQFVDLLTIEDDKEKNRLSIKNFLFFKGLFRNYDITFMPILLEQANRLIDKEDHINREANQRCASEIVGGLLRGSKHWDYEMRQEMWAEVILILRKVTTSLSVESTRNWAAIVIYTSEDQDPTRLHPLFNFLSENPLSGIGGAFGDTSRLFMLECVMVQQEWRLGAFAKKIGTYLTEHLDHPYKNVRDMIASLLVNINLFDVRIHPSIHPTSHPPQLSKFIQLFTQQLSPLLSLSKNSCGTLVGGKPGDKNNSGGGVFPLVTVEIDKELDLSPSATADQAVHPPAADKSIENKRVRFQQSSKKGNSESKQSPKNDEQMETINRLDDVLLEEDDFMDDLGLQEFLIESRDIIESGSRDVLLKKISDRLVDGNSSGAIEKLYDALACDDEEGEDGLLKDKLKQQELLNKLQQISLQQQADVVEDDDDDDDDDDENYKRLLRILKTVLKIIQGLQLKLLHIQQPLLLNLLPLIAAYEGDLTDADLSRECSVTMVTIAVTLLNKQTPSEANDGMMAGFVDAIKKTSETCSWKGRLAILTFMQRWIFKNLFLLSNNNNNNNSNNNNNNNNNDDDDDNNTVGTIKSILLVMLSDKNIEVRELAGVTISGLFQCGYLQVDDSITKYFKKLAATKIPKKKRLPPPPTTATPTTATPATSTPATSTPATSTLSTATNVVIETSDANYASDTVVKMKRFSSAPNATPYTSISTIEMPQDEAIILRHSGVIGLCACVNAHPYDVPSFLPSVLMTLTNHLHDPQPIQLTVKRSLTDFKRTHLDNWQQLKSNFTDNQLVVLTELLVSPNYYA